MSAPPLSTHHTCRQVKGLSLPLSAVNNWLVSCYHGLSVFLITAVALTNV